MAIWAVTVWTMATLHTAGHHHAGDGNTKYSLALWVIPLKRAAALGLRLHSVPTGLPLYTVPLYIVLLERSVTLGLPLYIMPLYIVPLERSAALGLRPPSMRLSYSARRGKRIYGGQQCMRAWYICHNYIAL